MNKIIFVVSALSQSTKQHEARFRALGNMGDVLLKMSNIEEALKVYAKQLVLSKQLKNKKLEAVAFGSLGVSHRIAKQLDKSLGFHTQVRLMFLFCSHYIPKRYFNN